MGQHMGQRPVLLISQLRQVALAALPLSGALQISRTACSALPRTKAINLGFSQLFMLHRLLPALG
jgi:hypothetical protein